MDINLEKIKLAQEIFNIKDENLFLALKNFYQKLKNNDEDLQPMSLEQFYAEIEESLQDSENNRVHTNAEVKNMIKKWALK